MLQRDIYPKDFIKEHFIEKLGEIILIDPYMSFLLVCSGIEFLGKCIDSKCEWRKPGLSKKHFENAIIELFPERYHDLRKQMYSNLRCGMVHMSGPGTIIVTQNKNDPYGVHPYKKHPDYVKTDGKELKVFVIEYFYFDFVEACKKVLSKDFEFGDKMNDSFLCVGPVASLIPKDKD
ncbi:MAG: hypothetical protein ABIG88_01365 [Patescibacteria group bacterium]|nr:hypothetical protein [Patescibacteria group bacterium]